MLALRRAVCEVLGRGVRSSCDLVSSGRQIVRRQPWIAERGCLPAAGTSLIQVARTYAKTREGISSQLDDLPPTLLKKEYEGLQKVEEVNDVVKRLLSLDLASQSDKLKMKTQQLVDKVKRNPEDKTSKEVQIAVLTARIQNFKEHIQLHPKDKANKRRMLMTIDRRKKMLKTLRLTRYDTFEHVCKELNIEYTFPPEYYRRATKRWQAKKALCLKVYEEVKKQKAAGLLQEKKPRRSRARTTPVQA
ncbi:PREDICTED: 28S ribosomal protein S15, mitochondrial [Nanorana parkeri]|uniref:28S ribosomal protein S15, mitochondrial n=1 Tax=Nanorana parkeri TaxID=125878 RepID=UPI000854EA5B|nr:PREDICTED: 28S ribosomal protein S15, mitochondrial [Nanorana parkeri]